MKAHREKSMSASVEMVKRFGLVSSPKEGGAATAPDVHPTVLQWMHLQHNTQHTVGDATGQEWHNKKQPSSCSVHNISAVDRKSTEVISHTSVQMAIRVHLTQTSTVHTVSKDAMIPLQCSSTPAGLGLEKGCKLLSVIVGVFAVVVEAPETTQSKAINLQY